jgi:hypothetical protein
VNVANNDKEHREGIDKLGTEGLRSYKRSLEQLLTKIVMGNERVRARLFSQYLGHSIGSREEPMFRPAGPVHVENEMENNGVNYTNLYGMDDKLMTSTIKVSDSFYEQFAKDSLKKFWADGTPEVDTTKDITSFCSEFLPSLTKKLGDNVFKDIFPCGQVNASALSESFKTNPNMQLIPGESAEKKADMAQKLANEGYLVFAAIDGGSHVAAVGPQSLNYGSYPEMPWKGNFPAFQNGNGYGGAGVLWQYPVFVQAGSYTGVVNPGNAMGRQAFLNNKVNYFLYKPRI